jgi:hypothetical protein
MKCVFSSTIMVPTENTIRELHVLWTILYHVTPLVTEATHSLQNSAAFTNSRSNCALFDFQVF